MKVFILNTYISYMLHQLANVITNHCCSIITIKPKNNKVLHIECWVGIQSWTNVNRGCPKGMPLKNLLPTEQRFSTTDQAPVFLKCGLNHFDSYHKIDSRNAQR